MKLQVLQDFSWAHRGVRIEEFKKGDEIETDDKDLIEVSLKEKWTAKTKAANKAEQGAAAEVKKKELAAKIAKLEGDLITAEGEAVATIEGDIAAARAELVALG